MGLWAHILPAPAVTVPSLSLPLATCKQPHWKEKVTFKTGETISAFSDDMIKTQRQWNTSYTNLRNKAACRRCIFLPSCHSCRKAAF